MSRSFLVVVVVLVASLAACTAANPISQEIRENYWDSQDVRSGVSSVTIEGKRQPVVLACIANGINPYIWAKLHEAATGLYRVTICPEGLVPSDWYSGHPIRFGDGKTCYIYPDPERLQKKEERGPICIKPVVLPP